jgi:hypothetical protein
VPERASVPDAVTGAEVRRINDERDPQQNKTSAAAIPVWERRRQMCLLVIGRAQSVSSRAPAARAPAYQGPVTVSVYGVVQKPNGVESLVWYWAFT